MAKKGQNAVKNKVAPMVGAIIAVLIFVGLVRPGILNQPVSEDTVQYSVDEKVSKNIVLQSPEKIPDYYGEDVIILNDNVPSFSEYDISAIEGEFYSDLDYLGRCGVAYARLHRSMYPNKERGNIGHIKPSGWVQEKYPGLVNSDPPYLYNRSHLIAHAMTGQSDNKYNLITGTRYMNADLMQDYEKQVLRYLDNNDNHVLYRVTPFFKGNELLARGVEMEAYSIEDEGEGLSFHVFIYNVQPGVEIDYSTGESRA